MSLGKLAAAYRRQQNRVARTPEYQLTHALNRARAEHWYEPGGQVHPGEARAAMSAVGVSWPPGDDQLAALTQRWGLRAPADAAMVCVHTHAQDIIAPVHIEQWRPRLRAVPAWEGPIAREDIAAWRLTALAQEIAARVACVHSLAPGASRALREHLAGLLTTEALGHLDEPELLAFDLMEAGAPGEAVHDALVGTLGLADPRPGHS